MQIPHVKTFNNRIFRTNSSNKTPFPVFPIHIPFLHTLINIISTCSPPPNARTLFTTSPREPCFVYASPISCFIISHAQILSLFDICRPPPSPLPNAHSTTLFQPHHPSTHKSGCGGHHQISKPVIWMADICRIFSIYRKADRYPSDDGYPVDIWWISGGYMPSGYRVVHLDHHPK